MSGPYISFTNERLDRARLSEILRAVEKETFLLDFQLNFEMPKLPSSSRTVSGAFFFHFIERKGQEPHHAVGKADKEKVILFN